MQYRILSGSGTRRMPHMYAAVLLDSAGNNGDDAGMVKHGAEASEQSKLDLRNVMTLTINYQATVYGVTPKRHARTLLHNILVCFTSARIHMREVRLTR